MDSGKIFHWREDALKMNFEDFSKCHSDLFSDEYEMKEAYQKVTGKDSNEKPKRVFKQESKEGDE